MQTAKKVPTFVEEGKGGKDANDTSPSNLHSEIALLKSLPPVANILTLICAIPQLCLFLNQLKKN